MSILMALVFFSSGLFGQSKHKLLRSGDQFYYKDKFKTAEEAYRKALEKETSPDIQYNLANSIYKQNRMVEAIEKYERAAASASNENLKSKAFHNLGNAYYHNKNYEKSIDAYQQSLLLNPDDLETKENLVRAQKQMQIQQQQQQQNQNDNKDNNQQQDQEQQQQENQEDQNKEQNQNENQQQQQPQNQENKNQQQEKPNDLTKREAEKLLDIMDQEEQKVQEKLQKGQNTTVPNGKDW
jgi:Ca-activated chloride channel family protein